MVTAAHCRDGKKFEDARSLSLPVQKVLVIYTGGTVGMKITNNVYMPEAGYFERALRNLVILHDPEVAFPDWREYDPEGNYLYLNTGGNCVAYYVLEYSDLIDSSCMGIDQYRIIVKDIEVNYEHFNGFVILHGTDTMAYTSSYLSFMFENLSKPVILTGSQLQPSVNLADD
ncbi:hypothetical protein ACOME3_000900 [Neoechinorhynchus agilis]